MRKPNKLINEKSPYLLQHAYNPVDWYPWGEEAFEKARRENKPIFLSIGYSSCHWCHVMEKESFEDKHIADLLNTYYVPVKVDREERPDVDEFYMRCVMLMTGHGGWPLTVILTPDLKPIFGGTYFPPRRRGGLRGLDEILKAVAELWAKKPEELLRTGEEISDLVKKIYVIEESPEIPSLNVIYDAYDVLVTSYDALYGGFGSAPKFPMPVYIEFLFSYFFYERESHALKMAVNTLEKMARGGIFDQIGGGFFRYSTDRVWLIPHFEKMLYDNAQLAKVYFNAYLLTGDKLFKETAAMTLDWILNNLADESGGFYSSVDADSPEGEGAFYLWRKSEMEQCLEPELYQLAVKAFSVSENGNFKHGLNILTFPKKIESLAQELNLKSDEVEHKLRDVRAKLLEVRNRRPAPAVDTKIIASWNALAIEAFLEGYKVLGESRYLHAALKATNFILNNLWGGGQIHRYFREKLSGPGFLEDYSFTVNALLEVFQTTFEPKYLKTAIEIADKMIEYFWDPGEGGFFYSYEEIAGITRLKDAYDGVMPSGNSIAAKALLKLYEHTGNQDYLTKIESLFKAFSARIRSHPTEYTSLLTALAAYHKPRTEIVISANDVDGAKEYLNYLNNAFHPFKVVSVVGPWNYEELSRISPLVVDKKTVGGKTTAYICESYTCRFPIVDLNEFVEALGWRR